MMKKNYIARLKEYDARTTTSSKQNNYRQKFIHTVYSQDKENVNPNIVNLNSQKKKGKAKVENSRNSQPLTRVSTETKDESIEP